MRRTITFCDRRFDDSSGYPLYHLKLEAHDDVYEGFNICIDNDEDEKELLKLLEWIPKKEGKKLRRLSKEEEDYLRSLPSNAVYYK